jgi:hypothetical protein
MDGLCGPSYQDQAEAADRMFGAAAFQLSKEQKQILECVFSVWEDNEMPLYGEFNYAQVLELCDKLGFKAPKSLLRLGGRCK